VNESLEISEFCRAREPGSCLLADKGREPAAGWFRTLGAQPSSDVGLCLYLHLSLDEGSMVIFEILISVTVEQSQFRHPLLCC
ncbi:hypothetical protein LEMLEM_LOCUS18397, partial [Lemmus lemmus]